MTGAAALRAALAARLDRLAGNARNARAWLRFCWAHRSPQARLQASTGFESRHTMSLPIRVDTDASEADLARLVRRIEATWTRFGEVDPHWSVLTSPQFRRERIAETVGSFYATGEESVGRVRAAFARTGADLAAVRDVIDYGCGVGRVSAAFARAGFGVTGADISATHLAIAGEHCARAGLAVRFRRIAGLADIDRLPPADLFFSVLVLQHNPPPIIAEVLRRALARVRPGGYAWFQVPTYHAGYHYDLARDLAGAAPDRMEHHVLPQPRLFAILDAAGFLPLELRPHNAVGKAETESHVVLARRRAEAPAPAPEGDPDG